MGSKAATGTSDMWPTTPLPSLPIDAMGPPHQLCKELWMPSELSNGKSFLGGSALNGLVVPKSSKFSLVKSLKKASLRPSVMLPPRSGSSVADHEMYRRASATPSLFCSPSAH